MPGKTLKNRSGRRIFKISGSPVPIVQYRNNRRTLTFKLPANLLEPKELLKAKQKNKANVAKAEAELRRIQQERERARASFLAALYSPNQHSPAPAMTRRGPGARGSSARTIPPDLLAMMRGNSSPPSKPVNVSVVVSEKGASTTIRKADLLKMERAAKKAAAAAAESSST